MSVVDNLKKEFERAEMARAENVKVSVVGDDALGVGEMPPDDKFTIPREVVSLQTKKQELSGEAAALARFDDCFVSTEGGQTYVFREIMDPELGEPTLQRQTVKSFHELFAGETVMMSTGAQATSRVWLAGREPGSFGRDAGPRRCGLCLCGRSHCAKRGPIDRGRQKRCQPRPVQFPWRVAGKRHARLLCLEGQGHRGGGDR